MSITEGAPGARSITPRQVAGAVVGNALEFYDFTVYAIFADQIGHAFFPTPTPFVSQILTLATFGVGFLLRPLGAVLIGRLADRRGRRPAMLFSFALMGASILGLALTPSYATIGALAPCLVLFWRLCQGFALGGELGPTTAYLVEAAPPEHRGLYGAWQGGSQNVANLVGALVGMAVGRLFGDAALALWGWRAAFLLGTIVLPFGLVIRRSLPETLHHPEEARRGQAEHPTLMAAAPVLLRGFGLIAATTIPTYVFLYLTTYAIQTLHMGKQVSLAATFVSGLCGVAGGLLGGVLSDRFGRRALLIWPRTVFLLATWPVFDVIVRHHDAPSLLIGTAVLSFSSALSTASVYVAITESLRKEVRVTGLGALYAIAVAVFGGTTQPIVRWLIEITHDPRSIAAYTIAATLVGLIASATMRETAVRRLRVEAARSRP
jgi:MFS family permease